MQITVNIIANADAVAARAASLARMLRDGDAEDAAKLAREMRLMLTKIEKACKTGEGLIHKRYNHK